MAESNNNSFSFFADKQEQMNVANYNGGLSDIAAAFASGSRASDGDQSNVAAHCWLGNVGLARGLLP
jgi:hypothetical protein